MNESQSVVLDMSLCGKKDVRFVSSSVSVVDITAGKEMCSVPVSHSKVLRFLVWSVPNELTR
jgi:hypothetical protein